MLAKSRHLHGVGLLPEIETHGARQEPGPFDWTCGHTHAAAFERPQEGRRHPHGRNGKGRHARTWALADRKRKVVRELRPLRRLRLQQVRADALVLQENVENIGLLPAGGI